jgi:3-oxo-5-alpha-steroid 4-dehydrogenase 1
MPYYTLFITIWIIIGINAGIYLLKIAAPYGRYVRPGWGPIISNKTGWIVMESTVIITFLAWGPWNLADWKNPSNIMVALFLLHYLHRALIYPLRIRTKGKRMPLVIMVSAMLFNGVNGSLLGIWFARYARYDTEWYFSFPFIAGILLFFSGMAINISSDNLLIALRRHIHAQNTSFEYQIPYGGFFRFISSPNLFGEIMEWAGYALLTWSYPALAFFIWTCANLVPRAITNHRWYQEKFPEYPPDRKILVPWVW